jgi:uncharacterized membrane protein YtjA (UPF0391 family)
MGKLSHWAVVLTALAVLYALLGFGEFAGSASPTAKFMSVLSVGVAAILLAAGWLQNNH